MKQLVIVFFLLFGTVLMAQDSSLRIEEHFVDTPLPEVLSLLKKKYDLKIAYDNSTVENIVVNQKIDQLSLEKTLERICDNTVLTYQVVSPQQVLIWEDKDYEFTPILTKVEYMNFKGRLLDAETGEPLAYATLHSIPGDRHCTTDDNGRFSMEVPKLEGVSVSIRYLGYETKMVDANKINPTIHLHPQSQQIGTVEVLAKTPMIQIAAAEDFFQFSPDQLRSVSPGVTRDLFRQLQLLPGIAAHDDLSAELSVRGSDGDENMVLLDGIPLYNVTHFFGVFSNVNSTLVDNVKIYKNTFPVEYGGRTSSVIDISTKESDGSGVDGTVEADFLNTSMYTTFPLGQKMNLLLGGRFTNQNIAGTTLFGALENSNRQTIETRNRHNDQRINLFLDDETTANFRFNDWNARWNFQISPRLSASASGFIGNDSFSYNQLEELNFRNTNIASVDATENVQWENKGFSFRLRQQWNDRFDSQLTTSRSGYYLNNKIYVEELVPRRINNVFKKELHITDQRRINDVTGTDLNLTNHYRINDQGALRFGYNLTNHQTQFTVLADSIVKTQNPTAAFQHALYAQYKGYEKNTKLEYGLGLRATYYTATNDFYFSPRLQLGYRINEGFRLKAAASRYHQFLQQNYREDRFGRSYQFWSVANHNPDEINKRLSPTVIPVSSSNHFMLGFNWINPHLTIDVEAYQKNTLGIVEQAATVNSANQLSQQAQAFNFINFAGDRRVIGLDILLKKSSARYDGWLAYTLSKTEQRFSVINNNQYFPSQNDRRHQLNWVNVYKLGSWEISGTYVFSSGIPITDLTLLSRNDRERTDTPFSERTIYLKNYHRMDLGLSYRFPIRSAEARITLSVFNLFDHQNVKYRQYFSSLLSPESTDQELNVIGTEVKMLGRTPNLSFSVDF
ncbi:MAG: carboxypeptidase-like regulatory domain-containing protein [Bacteroidota bacterium]